MPMPMQCPKCRDAVTGGLVHAMFFHGDVVANASALVLASPLRTMITADGPVYWVSEKTGWTSLKP